jgi:squalene-associated FAD-dependent desaturase
LLHRIGAAHLATLQYRLDIPVLRADAPVAHLRRASLPAPLHLALALARYPLLSRRERWAAARVAWRLRRLGSADPSRDEQSFGDWLRAQGQSPRATSVLWDLFVLAALNTASDQASFSLAQMVVRTGLLDRADAADIGLATVPLSYLHGGPAAEALRCAGADVRLRSAVQAIEAKAGGGHVVFTRTQRLEASAVIVAVPSWQVASLLPAGALLDPSAPSRLGSSAIVTVHLILDRPVLDLPLVAVAGSPVVQWVFDRTRASGLGGGQYLAVVISGADALVAERSESLADRVLASLDDLLPAVRGAHLERVFVTRVRRATFKQAPGCGALRPGPRTRLPGLFLAGAWTDTGWPATMEGAVRSGEAAARCALSAVRLETEPLGSRDE